jgi:predicted PurR-regulated permease PerM
VAAEGSAESHRWVFGVGITDVGAKRAVVRSVSEPSRLDLRVPFLTLLKIALFSLLVVCTIRLWPYILLFLISVLIAVALEPVVACLQRHRVRRGLAVGAIATLIVALLGVFFVLLLPQIGSEMSGVGRDLGRMRASFIARIPRGFESVKSLLTGGGGKGSPQQWLHYSLLFGKYTIEAVVGALFTLVVSMYLLLEGKTMYAWLVSFVPPARRDRVAQTAEEVSAVIRAYMRGQLLTSAICAAFVFTVLLILRVPAALFLAIAAGVFDIIPVIGTMLLILAPALVAATVSTTKAMIVVALLLLYHLAENYFIVPRVYGSQMRMSTLTVLLVITVGGALQGIIGMVLILPLAAAYPVIERIWLRRYVGSYAVDDHQRLENDESERVADDIART